jgi:hypothetical protein
MSHTFGIPKIDYYPSDLDDTELDQIKAAELRAAGVIALKRSSVRSEAEKKTLLLRDWVLQIFDAFSKLAFKRAKKGIWAIHKADSESREFLDHLAAAAGMNGPDAWMAGGGTIIRAEIQREIEDSPEWKAHQEKLLELIDARDNAVIPTTANTEIREAIAAGSKFWKERQDEFLRHTLRFGGLSAKWRAKFRRWTLGFSMAGEGQKVPRKCVDAFNAVARRAIVPLANLRNGAPPEPLAVWLDFMRAAGKCESAGSPIAVSELEWRAGVETDKPLSEVRRELKLSTLDEAGEPFKWIQDQVITNAFQASADFCEELSAYAFEMEASAIGFGSSHVSSESPAPTTDHSNGSDNDGATGHVNREIGKSMNSPARTHDSAPSEGGSDLAPNLWLKIRADLLGIDANRTDGRDTKACLNEAYHVFARGLSATGEPLNDSILHEMIPARVFQWAVARKWLAYPPQRVRRSRNTFVPGKYESAFEPIPEGERTVPFGVYMITEKYKFSFLRQLELAIAEWEAERAELEAPQGKLPKHTAANKVPTSASNSNRAQHRAWTGESNRSPAPAKKPLQATVQESEDRFAMVDDFLANCNVEARNGLKLLKKHIWRAVGHKVPRQFQYWQKKHEKATAEDDRNFRRILSMTPAEFISLLRKKRIVPSVA